MLTDQLDKEGLVEFVDNPAHKRSWLVRLTDKGRALMETMTAREARVFKDLPVPASEQDIHTATAVLRSFREFFHTRAWRDAVDRAGPLTKEEE
jgi:DNA-binding MarR family transcriptional regulator